MRVEVVSAIARQGISAAYRQADWKSAGSVKRIAHEGMADRRKVDSDLMRAASQNAYAEQTSSLFVRTE